MGEIYHVKKAVNDGQAAGEQNKDGPEGQPEEEAA